MKNLKGKVIGLVLILFLVSVKSEACTRIIYVGKDENILTARTMDWKYEMDATLWIFPRGIKRNGLTGKNSIEWVSKYGSVIVSSMEIATSDGVNEKGLAANLLWLGESQYPLVKKADHPMSLSLWAQYVLDNFSTVNEVVKTLEKNPLVLVTSDVPEQNRKATLHLSLSDVTGDSAIIEYVNGKQVIYHSKNYKILTNSPTYEKQLAISSYWKGIDGLQMLPGTNKSSDRFVRADFYTNIIPKDLTGFEAVGAVLSILRNVSVPFGIGTNETPEISSTRWRTVFDHKNKNYYFDSVLSPNVIWTDLNKIDFSFETGKIKKLPLGKKQDIVYNGEVNDSFVEAIPFNFLGTKVSIK